MKWILILCALATVALAPEASAARSARYEGAITAVSAASLPPTVTLSNGSTDVTVNITAQTRIRIGDERGLVTDLRTGAAARATYDARTLNAISLHVEGNPDEATARGVMLSADGSSGAFSVDTDGDGDSDLDLTADAQTDIKVHGVAIELEQLDVLTGLRVEVEYNSLTNQVYKIRAEAELRAVTGQVSAISETSLTLTTPAGERTFELSADTDVRLLGHKVGLPAVQIGDVVRVTFVDGEEADLALRVMVQGVRPRHVNGTLTAVGDGTLTVKTRTGDVVLQVSALTDLRANSNRAATLADLQAALTAGATVRISGVYFVRASGNFATQIRANIQRRR